MTNFSMSLTTYSHNIQVRITIFVVVIKNINHARKKQFTSTMQSELKSNDCLSEIQNETSLNLKGF